MHQNISSLSHKNLPRPKGIPGNNSDAHMYLSMYQTIAKKEHVEKELRDLERRTKKAKQKLAMLEEQISKYPALSPELKNPTQSQTKQHTSMLKKHKTLNVFDKTSTTGRGSTQNETKFTTITMGY
ncbi:MAG: hypothetical protein MK289_22110 [Trichodesmium sp. ALOHA_ZT_67]|uniref:hypothetical protein n=1 Tax=Trichodesmium erythraeum TaxID=1206 RepID=UPI00003C9B86|nr:hypothetical protein [Trichodesmium erythraeum GBRTRLIN201]MCH2051053.1 hypothetical protein [Trichodesmium sp. ALOHA_ZT_67]MDE5096415.1 hypothetical protein [Trichodesmium sp. St11_bin5]